MRSPPTAADRLAALTRADKWFLSAGDGFVWAPPLPRWLHRPGFWDPGHIFYHPMAPIFSVVLVDDRGREIPLVRGKTDWRPDRLTVEWQTPDGPTLHETRAVRPGGRFCSEWTAAPPDGWRNTFFAGCGMIAFTAQPGVDTDGGERTPCGIRWERRLIDRRAVTLSVDATLEVVGAEGARPPRIETRRSQGDPDRPEWANTPFVERWDAPAETSNDGLDRSGAWHAAVTQPVEDLGNHPITFTMMVAPRWNGESSPANPAPRLDTPSPERFFESFPSVDCDDPHLDGYFDYRVYGLYLNRLAPIAPNLPHPAVAEGIEYFHLPISYSAQCHMWETRWSHDPDLAQGSLRNFVAHQREDGSFPGRVYPNHERGTDFYHANWGDAVLAVDRIHPDDGFLRDVYPALAKYARWIATTRDREGSGMYDVIDQFETGQEYMSRYQAVDADADRYGWENRIRVKGVDVTVYTYQLYRALEHMAERLGVSEGPDWTTAARRVGAALLDTMWDPRLGIFTDVDPVTGRRTGVKAAVGFYPLLTDLLGVDHVDALLGHLADPDEFATPFPVPSSSVDDPLFSPYAEWRGKRHVCPWNGRVWPMTNSHIVEGLLRQWHAGRRQVGERAATILHAFVRMMHFDGDPRRPNCFEHYNPLTGAPSQYRGIDDYQHSWVADLILRGVAGLEPKTHALIVDPLPLTLRHVRVDGAILRGHTVSLRSDGGERVVSIDGRDHTSSNDSSQSIPW